LDKGRCVKRTEAETGLVTCRNSKGVPVRGSLLRVSPQGVVFEVYNPFSLVQLSEVLTDFRIQVGARTLYAGRATTSSLVNTGLLMIVEVTLANPLTLSGTNAGLPGIDEFRGEVEEFLAKWQTSALVRPEFKVAVNDMRSFLLDLSLWLNQTEFVLREASDNTEHREHELVDAVAAPVRPMFAEFLGRLGMLGESISREAEASYKTYICRALHPVMMCSPFIYRTVTKPLGYAGDYEMINMILGEPRRGETLFAKTLNALVLEVEAAEAHRNRITELARVLTTEGHRTRELGRRMRVLNVGCGPSKEVRDFIRSSPDASRTDITLLDFSPEALAFAQEKTEAVRQEVASGIRIAYVEKSVDDLLRESVGAQSGTVAEDELYDLVYCAGLFDYFIDPVCKRMVSLFYRKLVPGGLVVVTNLHPRNPVRWIMEYLLAWVVIHRDERQLGKLDDTGGKQNIYVEPTGVNVFLCARKPERES